MIFKSKWLNVLMLAALSFGLLALLSSCPENGVGPTAEDGTITVRVTGAGDHNGKAFFCVAGAAGVDLNDPSNFLGETAGDVIASGTVESTINDLATKTTPVIFTGGESYDLGGFIDVDGSDLPTNGDYIIDVVKTVVVDGNMVVEFVYPDDFTEVTGMPPEDGTITVGVIGAGDHNGENFLLAVFAAGADPEVDDPIGWNTAVIVSGMAQGVVLDPENLPAPFTFTGGTTYDVYGLIDLDGSTDLTIGDYVSQKFSVEVDGDMVVEFDYPTDFVLSVDPIIGVWEGTWYDIGGEVFSETIEYKADVTFTITMADVPPTSWSVTFSGTYVHDSTAQTVTITVTSSTDPSFVDVGYTHTSTYSLSADKNTIMVTASNGSGTFTRQ